jgi:hypothetical protein
MSILNRIDRRVKARPAPVRTTVVLFDGGRRHRVPDFGKGLLRSVPGHRLPCTLADLDAVAGLFADTDRERAEARLAVQEEYDARVDQAAFEDACLQRYTRGYCL